MDEPVYYGHIWNGPNACHSSIPDIAKEIAENLRQVRTIFPQAQFGEAEPMPIPGVPLATWLADLETFFDTFQASSGQKVAFFRADVVWSARVATVDPPLGATAATEAGIPLQVIYDSNGPGRECIGCASDCWHDRDFQGNMNRMAGLRPMSRLSNGGRNTHRMCCLRPTRQAGRT